MTRRVSLLGKPLKRRHSVVMHNAAFEAAGIDARYELQELESEQLAGFIDRARGPDFLGLGVTAPHKKRVAELVDEVEPDARQIGAVNNVVRTDDGRLVGFNTDAPGFRAGVELAIGGPLAGASVVVVGAGGVAQAIVHACREAGVGRLTVANRSLPASPGGVEAVGLESEELRAALASADLAVNATTVGMVDGGMAFPVDALPDRATVFDVVYVPAETELLRAARARGLRAANGSEMLIAQAAIAFERWTGVGGMTEVMRQAVAPLLADPQARA
ncbi:MAG TPA: shikimate dehydrogenase [Candidatus Limnocylindrales bacterium]|nr:shikimate dehydrogenase [Candidatus Limnocylindrales bacterium]